MNELMQSLFICCSLLFLIPFLLLAFSSFIHFHSVSNIHKSISYYFISYFIFYSFYYSHRIFIECPKGIQFIFIYYHPDLLFYQGYYYRDARIDIINNDLFAILNINKYIQSLFLPDFIALLGFIDSALGPIDRLVAITNILIELQYLCYYYICIF